MKFFFFLFLPFFSEDLFEMMSNKVIDKVIEINQLSYDYPDATPTLKTSV